MKPRLWHERHALLAGAFWLLLAFLILHHITSLVQYVRIDHFYDFAHYYLYARNLIDGHGVFDLEAPKLIAKQLGIHYAEAPPVYSPPFYVVVSPLAMLPYHAAAIVWLMLSELALFAALIWRGAWGIRHHPARMAALAFIVLAFQPLYETLAPGQVNLMLLAGITLMIRLWASGSSWCGVLLGLCVLMKPQFAALGLLWIRRSEWRHLGIAAGTVGAAVLGSLAVVGLEPWAFHLKHLRDFACDRTLWAINFSLRGILFRLKGGCDAVGFGDPMAVAAGLAGMAVLGLVAWHVWNNPPRDLTARFQAAGLILCAIFLASPYTQEHHLTLLLIVFAGLAIDRDRPGWPIHFWGWVLAYVLIAAAYSLIQFPSLHLGAPSLLLTGKAIGVVLVGWLLLTAKHPRISAAALLPPLVVSVGAARMVHAIVKIVVMEKFTPVVMSELILAFGLLLSWVVLFQIRRVQVPA